LDPGNNNLDDASGHGEKTGFQPVSRPGTAAVNFRKSRLSYFTLLLLLILWPVFSIAVSGDPTKLLEELSESPIYLVYLPTILIQWLIFFLIYLTVHHEGMGLGSIGYRRIRVIDFFWAMAFLLGSNLVLTLLWFLLSLVNLHIPGEIGLILPSTLMERILWTILALTAGVCEETAFRGYLITRLKIFGKSGGWIIPILASSLAFGSGHLYQGSGGFILITVYGAMFAVLFLKTGSLWPGIIAHSFQDFSALFFPFQR
jgi:membrane protease YdiL (CAAX protease family)